MAGIPSTAQSPNPYAAPTAGSTAAGSAISSRWSVLTTLFFMWGGMTSLNDVLIPHLKGIFSLSYFEAMLVQFCFFGAYGLMSIPAGRIVKKIGLQERDHGRAGGRGARLPDVLSRRRRRARTACS